MFQIGEFSRLGSVTIDTLRHYDALGLLKPAKVDPITGYRYYTARQLKTLIRIIALKEVGFSLEEIARILQDEPTRDELCGMLKAQLVLAKSEMEKIELRRDRILARLKSLTLEDEMPAYEVILKPVEAQTIAAIRETVSTIEQMPQRCGEMFGMIANWLKANGLPVGIPMTIYYNESYTRENIDTECAFSIPNAGNTKIVEPESPIIVRRMEEVPHVAAVIVTEDFYNKIDGLTPAYHAIAQWVENNGYRFAGPPRELFYGSPERGDFTAEVQFPVEKVESN